MSLNRPTITQILEKAFLKNPALYEKCRTTTINRIEAGDFTRIFNDYPAFICPADIQALRDRYLDLLRKITAAPVDSNNEIISKLSWFILDIAALGTAELLNVDGSFNPDLIKLLNLSQKHAEKLKGHDREIVKSYLNEVVGDVNTNTPLYNNRYEQARGVVVNYVSRHANEIITNALRWRMKDICLTRDFPKTEAVLNYTKEHPKETAAITVAGLLALAGLFGGGAAIVKAITSAPSVGLKPF